MIYDSSRDMVMVGLKQLYAGLEEEKSVNDPSANDLKAVEEWLISIKKSKTLIATEEVYDLMLDPTRVDLALAYSGDVAYLIAENDNLGYFTPQNQGTNIDRKSTRLNSSHVRISYAVFCLKKKKKKNKCK